MLTHTPLNDKPVQPTGEPQEILKWTADGSSLLLGFMGTGSYSGTFRLLVDGEPWYSYQTSPSIRTAYVADRAIRLEANTVVTITVEHDSNAVETFSATLLGGKE